MPRVPCTYLHVSAPALHGGGPVFELGILAVGALLVRDRLAQVGAHRSVTPCAFSCLVSAVAPAAKMSPAELTAERRSCLPRQPLRWVVARWNSHARLSLPFRIQRNLTPSVACHTSAACGRRALFVVDEVRIPSRRYSTAASTVKSFGRAVSHESRPIFQSDTIAVQFGDESEIAHRVSVHLVRNDLIGVNDELFPRLPPMEMDEFVPTQRLAPT